MTPRWRSCLIDAAIVILALTTILAAVIFAGQIPPGG